VHELPGDSAEKRRRSPLVCDKSLGFLVEFRCAPALDGEALLGFPDLAIESWVRAKLYWEVLSQLVAHAAH
jgi:hypothetical protein